MFFEGNKKTPFLVAISYLVSFISIRLMVIIAGSANSEIARVVKEGAPWTTFHIGRNIVLFGYHIHHFYFGVLLIALVGWLAITGTGRTSKERLAIIYGVGLGLFMDEIGLLLTWGNYASSLSYLLGILLLGILLSVVYFPRFSKTFRTKWSWMGHVVRVVKIPLVLLHKLKNLLLPGENGKD